MISRGEINFFSSMKKWWHVSLLLCCYGFFKEYRPSEPFISPFLTGTWKNFTHQEEYRPSEPFISPFLTGTWKNFTHQEVSEEIYPAGIYFNLSLLVVVFLLTDYLRYKPVLIIGGLAGIVTWTLLIIGKTIPVMQIVEFFYGLFMASEVAYYTYIYAKVEKEYYQKVTSHTRTAFLMGKASAGLSSQLFVEFNIFDYLELNYLTVCALVIATIVSFLLPSVPQSVYFHRYAPKEQMGDGYHDSETNSDSAEIVKYARKEKFRRAFHYLYNDIKEAYTNVYVVKWSIWWALATCAYLQIITYSQMLWQEINRDDEFNLINGLVEFVYSLIGAAAAFGIGYLKLSQKIWGKLVLGILTIVQGAVIFSEANLTSLYSAYALHISYGILYQSAITIASSEVAKNIREDSYALIFGINTFVASVFQTVLTAVVVNILGCPMRLQIYGCYLFVTGCVYLLV